jgi:phage shock protein A
MKSVADELRQRDREAVQALSVEERLELAFTLGDEGVAAFCAARGVSREEGIRLLQRQRQAGRTPSKCISDLIG